MFVKRLIQKATLEFPTQVEGLQQLNLEPCLVSHHGVPVTSSILAYDPLQHLLAIATSDGRIKLYGGDGIEGLLCSNPQVPSRFLEFMDNRGILVHVTTLNHIELWSLEKRQLVHVQKWETTITACAVIQGSSFIYVGDESGTVSVIEYNEEDQVLSKKPYNIPAHAVLGGTLETRNVGGTSVVSLLPQPESLYSRVLIVYGNGFICLWGLHEYLAVAIRGGTEAQYEKITMHLASGSVSTSSLPLIAENEDEEKEICCACWACPVGSIVAVGYVDGDIFLWGLPVASKGKYQLVLENSDDSFFSFTPLHKVQLFHGIERMPVVVLRWCTDGKGDAGRLYVFGGRQMGSSQVLTILPLEVSNGVFTEKISSHLELPLHGTFSDVILLPRVGSANNAVASAALVLTTPGKLDVYDEVDVSNFFKNTDGGPSQLRPEAVPFKFPLTQSGVTAAKLFLLAAGGSVAQTLSQIPISFKNYVPPMLKSGMRWPVTGGTASFDVPGRELEPQTIYVTGHEDGSVIVWDISSMVISLIASSKMQCHEKSRSHNHPAISAIDLCAVTGLLAAGSEEGLVSLYSLNAKPHNGRCHYVNFQIEHSEREINFAAGLQCIAVIDVHRSSIQSLVISDATSCLAIGDDNGSVSLFHLNSFECYYHGRCFPDSSLPSVVAIILRRISVPAKLHSERPQLSSVAYILAKDSSLVTVETPASTSAVRGPSRPKHPSVAVSLHLLDSSGTPVSLSPRINNSSREPSSEGHLSLSVDSQANLAKQSAPQGLKTVDEEYCSSNTGSVSTKSFLLICSEDCLRLYEAANVVKGDRDLVRKVKLNGQCCRSELVKSSTVNAPGLVLLYKSGLMELRSLQDLELRHELSFSIFSDWGFDPSLMLKKVSACSIQGRFALINGEELFYFSLFKEENGSRLSSSVPHLYDKDVAAATDAALKAPLHSMKKKSQIHDLLGGVMKEIRSSVSSREQSPASRGALELQTLFSQEHFLASPHVVNRKESVPNEAPTESTVSTLEIDDIVIEEDDSSPSPAAPKTSVVKKLKNTLPVTSVKKLKESFSGNTKSSPKGGSDDRSKLFEGGSSETKPSVRTIEEIKAAYGHRASGEASSAAGLARDKLLERQEKLQSINRRTEEMQEGAENFASLAEELAKKMESRKWWEI